MGIEAMAGGLPLRRRIGDQLQCMELAQDLLVHALRAARRVNVFDADQPGALVGAGIQPGGERCYQRAGMQRAGGRGGKTAGISA